MRYRCEFWQFGATIKLEIQRHTETSSCKNTYARRSKAGKTSTIENNKVGVMNGCHSRCWHRVRHNMALHFVGVCAACFRGPFSILKISFIASLRCKLEERTENAEHCKMPRPNEIGKIVIFHQLRPPATILVYTFPPLSKFASYEWR